MFFQMGVEIIDKDYPLCGPAFGLSDGDPHDRGTGIDQKH